MGFGWTSQPTHVRLFFLYLFVVLCICLVRSVRIAKYLSAKSPSDKSVERSLLDADVVGRFSVLTLLVSVLMCTYGAYPTWQSHFNNNKVTGSEAWTQTIVELLWRLSLGLLVSTILFATSSYLKSKLTKRKIPAE